MKISLVGTLMLFCMFMGHAQNSYEITEQSMPDNKMATSFTANIIGQNESNVYYQWQKFIESHKGKTYLVFAKEGNVEFESEHVLLPMLDNKSVTLHTRFSPNYSESGILLTLWIELPDGDYYSSMTDEDSAKKIKDWLLKYDLQLTEIKGRG
ncbi:hypothetical protein [Cellulophaga sp. L1A9]|uniref:hypothetical protein n=1 Tax=Cellulophaga sp. L1A9 TaxID=2686362 RepID=UPI00131C7D06|nr:hypothetical protein [Cellulophaga sp. L1A9]